MSETTDYLITAAGVDTFLVNYKFASEEGILSGASLPDHIQDELDVWQKAARKEQKPVPTSLLFSYEIKPGETVNQSLFMRSHGTSVWPWLLFSDDVKVDFAPGTLNKGLFCRVRFSAHLLWMIGPETAIVQAESMLHSYLGGVFHKQASEIHLCADITGFDFSRLTLAGEQLPFVSRVTSIKDRPVPPTEEEQEGGLTSKEMEELQDKIDQEIQEQFHLASLTTTHRRISTIDFGSHASPISAQIYNKSLEIKKHKKEWFEPIWQSNGWDGKSIVWRLEFRIKRSWLHSRELEEAFATLSALRALWTYLTQEWLRFIDLDGITGQNITRRPTHPVWEVLQHAYDNLDVLAERDETAEQELRLRLLLIEKPLQVLEQSVALAAYDNARDREQKERQELMVQEYTSVSDTHMDQPNEVVQALAHDAFTALSKEQQAQILEHLSADPFYQVQASLIKRERRMTRLRTCIAGGLGYLRAAIALIPPEELAKLPAVGPGVSASQVIPDLLSGALWFVQQARAYDEKKGRIHVEEVLKKQVAYGLARAQDLDLEHRLYGVKLQPEDVAAVDEVYDHFCKGTKKQFEQSLGDIQ